MKTVRAVLEVEIEIESGKVKDVVEELTDVLDGYQPVGGSLEFTVSEVRTVQVTG